MFDALVAVLTLIVWVGVFTFMAFAFIQALAVLIVIIRGKK